MSDPEKLLYTEASPFPNGENYKIDDWQRVPGIVHDTENIKGFFGEYRWLSNFGSADVSLDGKTYTSVELAYQAAKWLPRNRAYFADCAEKDSIAYNRDNNPDLVASGEWDSAKLGVMGNLLEQKFDPTHNPDNAAKLIETADRYLEETNWWNDQYWGKNLQGVGENNLGKLIMDIRSSLIEQATPGQQEY